MHGTRRLFSGQPQDFEVGVDRTTTPPRPLSRKTSKLRDLSDSVIRRMESVGRKGQQENPSNFSVPGFTHTGDQLCFQTLCAPAQPTKPKSGRSELQDRPLPDVLLPGRKQMQRRRPLHSTIPEATLLQALDTGDLRDLQSIRPTNAAQASSMTPDLPQNSAVVDLDQFCRHDEATAQTTAPLHCSEMRNREVPARQPVSPSVQTEAWTHTQSQRQTWSTGPQTARQVRPASPPVKLTFEAILGYDTTTQTGLVAGNHALSLQSAAMSGLLKSGPAKPSRPSDFIIKKRISTNVAETTWTPSSRTHAVHGYSRDSWSPLDEQRKFSTRKWSLSELIPHYQRIEGQLYDEPPMETLAEEPKSSSSHVRQQPQHLAPVQYVSKEPLQQPRRFLVPPHGGYWATADHTGSDGTYRTSTMPVQLAAPFQQHHEAPQTETYKADRSRTSYTLGTNSSWLSAPTFDADTDNKSIRKELHFDHQIAPRINFSLPMRAVASPAAPEQSQPYGRGAHLAIDFSKPDDDEEDWTASINRAAARVSQAPSRFPTPPPLPATRPAEPTTPALSPLPKSSEKRNLDSDIEETRFDPVAYPLLNALAKPLPPPPPPVKQVHMHHYKGRHEAAQRWFSWKPDDFPDKGKRGTK
jgi:hypothetical protein